MKNEYTKQLIPFVGISILVFLITITSMVLYSGNCASEFNGGKVSEIVVGWSVAAIVVAGITAVAFIASQFLIKDKTNAHFFYLARFGNYASFICLLGSFLFQILEEYSLLGTVLYPIVSGTVGDPVDPVLSTCYFTSLILSFVAMIGSLVSGIILRKKSHKILGDEQVAEGGK